MSNVIRVATSGNNALTDTDITHFSIFSDSDNVLIKEHSRGAGTIAYTSSETITHSLGYVPFFLVYGEVATNKYRVANAQSPLGGGWKAYATTTTLVITNNYHADYTGYQYYIFYDNMS